MTYAIFWVFKVHVYGKKQKSDSSWEFRKMNRWKLLKTILVDETLRKTTNLWVEIHSFFFYKNVVFPAQAEYSYFSADFRLKIFLYYS